MALTTQSLSGWGNCPIERCHVARPASLHDLQATLAAGEQRNYIARGLGRSYGDSALNANSGVIVQTLQDRFLAFDEQTGVVACESGVSLGEIIDTFLPRGWFLPTTPGTKFVTVGGAIAADVHGKNHHRDGSFGNFVEELKLLTASGEILTCSPHSHVELFWATVGGMGLTGIILSAKVRLMRVESAYYHVTFRRTANLEESLACFESLEASFRYTVAWIDCLASGKSLGRSVIMLANDATVDELPRGLRKRPLQPGCKKEKSVPFSLPNFTLNKLSVKAFNALYYGVHRDSEKYLDYDTFFYPLDSVRHWNRIYGRRGFVQYQALFPRETSHQGLAELLETLTSFGRASFLAVLKGCGPAGKGVLSYLYPGHTLAVDLPYTGDDLNQVVTKLDQILLKHGGRLYMAKDTLTTAKTFAQMYPRLDEFKAIKRSIDPQCRFASSQARRLGLLEQP